MQELIERLQKAHGLSQEQSMGILSTITGYIKEQFPMVSGAIDNLFQSGTTPAENNVTPSDVNEADADPLHDGGDFMNKIGDYIPGATGESAEEAQKKLGEFFSRDKKI